MSYFSNAVRREYLILFILGFLVLISQNSLAQTANDGYAESAVFSETHGSLPYDVKPVLGAWFWSQEEFLPEGYKTFIDQVVKHSCYNVLTTDIRLPGRDITDIDVYKQVKFATEYAKEKGIRIVLSMDPRTARRKFEEAYPDELQESLWLKEVELSTDKPVDAVIKSIHLSDHMNSRKTPYISFDGSLMRVYSYNKTEEGADPATMSDITGLCSVISLCDDSILVRIPEKEAVGKQNACIMVSYKHLTPDVFAPHLIEFTREIIRNYSDIPLAGGMRDEWGFPPSTPADRLTGGNHFWYSKHYAVEYSKKTGGRELIADCFLMYIGIKGKESERFKAINNYMELNRLRNSELENDFYTTVKEIFGHDALILSHPTWYPYPNKLENKKNGLFWWTATRDWAQTDEVTPFAARTALAKKWNSSVWYNQYYSTERKNYGQELWSSVLGGGRLNYHPIYPNQGKATERYRDLFRGRLMRGESRVRLLNFISESPLDCPVAVIFGHASTMNWAGPYFEDLGMQLVDSLWSRGIPTDLIPTSEIENNSLVVDDEGWISYGKQRYSAVVLYNPEFEKVITAEFFNRAASGRTEIFRVGNWTRNFEGEPIDGNELLSDEMVIDANDEMVIKGILKILKRKKIEFQTPASRVLDGFRSRSAAPSTQGFCRLTDGTVIYVSGTNDIGGDLIQTEIKTGRHKVVFDAIGLAAVRLDDEGNVMAIAAGGLKYFKAGDLEINLNERIDFALWKTDAGKFQGVIQGSRGEVPPQLSAITREWIRLSVPVSMTER